MNVLTVLEQPALLVELGATLELAADFAKASRALDAGPAGASLGIGVQLRSGGRQAGDWCRRPPGRGAAGIGDTRRTHQRSTARRQSRKHSSTFWNENGIQ